MAAVKLVGERSIPSLSGLLCQITKVTNENIICDFCDYEALRRLTYSANSGSERRYRPRSTRSTNPFSVSRFSTSAALFIFEYRFSISEGDVVDKLYFLIHFSKGDNNKFSNICLQQSRIWFIELSIIWLMPAMCRLICFGIANRYRTKSCPKCFFGHSSSVYLPH